jgi:methyl-coenzyme M reductase subunit D
MTEATYPQCRIVPLRFLKSDSAQRLLNAVVKVDGVRRMIINGPRLPATVPYGPARGKPNPHSDRKKIMVGDTEIQLEVQVGVVILEVEEIGVIAEIRKVCDEVLNIPYTIDEGTFMKPVPTISDYAKYGPDADPRLLGLADPRSRGGPVIIQGLK